MDKKQFFTSHAKSSAMLVSLGVHAVIIIIAISFVAVKVIERQVAGFIPEVQVKRPKAPLRKLKVPVNMKKRKAPKPRLRRRLVSDKKSFSAIKMPEMTGVKGGLGNMGGDQLATVGFGDLDVTLFGGESTGGNELVGTFYDLKVSKNEKPTKIATAKTGKEADALYFEVLNKFIKGWNKTRLDGYFQARKKKHASVFMIPRINANAAPEAYGVDNVVKPKHWVAHYEGSFSAPETGHYRFCGIADDVLLVRVRNRLVIDASYPEHKGKISLWESDHEDNRKYPMLNQHLVIGDWFKLTKDIPETIEILLGECPGGKFYCQLLIEKKKDTSYKQVSYTYKKGKTEESGTRPILPVFKLKEIAPELLKKMKINPNEATTEGPTFGVVK